jgi:hypothetical protein
LHVMMLSLRISLILASPPVIAGGFLEIPIDLPNEESVASRKPSMSLLVLAAEAPP